VDRATDLEMDPEVTPVETKAVRRKRRLAMVVPRHQSFGKRGVKSQEPRVTVKKNGRSKQESKQPSCHKRGRLGLYQKMIIIRRNHCGVAKTKATWINLVMNG
jgi:hypothetical protein